MKPWSGINVEIVSLAEKIETGGRGEVKVPPVSIFSGQTDSFNILCQYLGFMKLLKN